MEDSKLVSLPLYTEEFSVTVSKSSELSVRTQIYLKELKDLSLVMFPDHHQCRKLVNSYCEDQGFDLTPIIETSTMISLKRFVKNNIGGTVLPKPLLQTWDDRYYHIINLVEPTPKRDIGIPF